MPQSRKPVRRPRLILVPVRIVLLTFLFALLSFAVGLLLGIAGVLVVSRLRGVAPNLTLAYRHVALPAAGVAGAIVLAWSAATEVQHYRQAKALAEIERAGQWPARGGAGLGPAQGERSSPANCMAQPAIPVLVPHHTGSLPWMGLAAIAEGGCPHLDPSRYQPALQ